MSENKITLKMSMLEVAAVMSEGNPGALRVCIELLEDPLGVIFLCKLEDAKIYGSNIWIEYKDKCNSDITVFKKKIMNNEYYIKENL